MEILYVFMIIDHFNVVLKSKMIKFDDDEQYSRKQQPIEDLIPQP